jgi:hypothetical protein
MSSVEDRVHAAMSAAADANLAAREIQSAPLLRLPSGPAAGDRRRHVPRRWIRGGMRPVIAGALAVAIGGGTAIGVTVARSGHASGTSQSGGISQSIAWSGRPAAAWPQSDPSYGRATTAAQLIDYATRASVAGPGRAPQLDEWVVTKFELADSSQTPNGGGLPYGPLDQRQVFLQWHRTDGCYGTNSVEFPASLAATKTVTGKLTVSENPDAKYGGATSCLSLAGWKSVTYSYLNSLPTDPAKLEAIILRYNHTGSMLPTPADAVFAAIATLLEDGEPEGVVVPPKLEATLYRILQQLPGVHFENDTDLAGRHGLGFWNLTEGYVKYEIVIDPATYHYMGSKEVAVKDHLDTAAPGPRLIKAAQVLNWQALLGDAIVQHPGQLP